MRSKAASPRRAGPPPDEVPVKFYSQVGQDRFLLENFFRGKRGGVFVDVGAYDGETYSNTSCLADLGWRVASAPQMPRYNADEQFARPRSGTH